MWERSSPNNRLANGVLKCSLRLPLGDKIVTCKKIRKFGSSLSPLRDLIDFKSKVSYLSWLHFRKVLALNFTVLIFMDDSSVQNGNFRLKWPFLDLIWLITFEYVLKLGLNAPGLSVLMCSFCFGIF